MVEPHKIKKNMEKLEKIFWAFVTISEVAIVAFWIARVKNNMELAANIFFVGGAFATLALGCLGVYALRKRSRGY